MEYVVHSFSRSLTYFQYPLLASDIDFRGTQEDPHAVSALLKMYLRQCKCHHDSYL
jgi:hypothetical protein